MPENTVILPTPTLPYHHFIPTPTPFVSVMATPSAPTELDIVEVVPEGRQVDWMFVPLVAVGVVIAALSRFVKRAR